MYIRMYSVNEIEKEFFLPFQDVCPVETNSFYRFDFDSRTESDVKTTIDGVEVLQALSKADVFLPYIPQKYWSFMTGTIFIYFGVSSSNKILCIDISTY